MVSRIPGPALVLTGLLVLGGCGGTDKTPETAPTTAPATPGAPTASADRPTTTAPTPTGVTTAPAATADPCNDEQRGELSDGTWDGPLRMDVQGTGGETSFTSSTGRGRLHLLVSNGRVTRGTWRVRWTSVGHVRTENAVATVDVAGSIAGTVSGTASKPVLSGSWRVKGAATITEPVHRTAPIDETGPDTETLTLGRSTLCGAGARGSFVPSFDSKDAAAHFSGKAVWEGGNLSLHVDARN